MNTNKPAKASNNAITPSRQEDYPEWYQQVIKAAELAEVAPVRGCMVIKPWGYALWEQIQRHLDQMIKDTGHENFYCPLFVPLSFLQREADHVEGFAKECAVVTHHRLETDANGKLVPAAPLEDPLIVRPTSEAIIGEMFAKWVNSYRDLPLLMNQWANVVRWEMRPRLFLRTTEFLWQEGHTAHATAQEAIVETKQMLGVYQQLLEEYLATPVIAGEKTADERFPGASNTYTLEAMMQDGKALQTCTSHFLGQNFSKVFNIKFLSAAGNEEFAWTTSWGMTTRVIGSLVMTHGDDDGLVLPPRIAPVQIVILPLIHKEHERDKIIQYCEQLAHKLQRSSFAGEPIRVKLDSSAGRAGDKAWRWVKKGVPLRIEIGSKELEQQSVFVGRRDRNYRDKYSQPAAEFVQTVAELLAEIQQGLFNRAKQFLQNNIKQVKSKAEFYEFFSSNNNVGFAQAPWIGDAASAEAIKRDLKVTARCIPNDFAGQRHNCIFTGKPNAPVTIFGTAY